MIRQMLVTLALAATILAPTTAAHAASQEDGTVVAILGDDTVAVRFPGTVAATTIRLSGVNVPKDDECGHMAMLRYLDAAILNKVVTVEFDKPLHARDGAVRAWLWRGLELNEELTVQEQAGAYAEAVCH